MYQQEGSEGQGRCDRERNSDIENVSARAQRYLSVVITRNLPNRHFLITHPFSRRVKHNNIVSLVDLIDNKTHLYLVMDL